MLKNIIKTFAHFSHLSTLTLALTITALFSTGGFFSRDNELCELLSHLRLAYCIATFVILLLLIICKAKIKVAIAVVIFIVNLVPVLSLYAPQKNGHDDTALKLPAGVDEEEQQKTIKLLEMNLWGGRNHNHAAALKLVSDTTPDIIGFSEVTGTWGEILKEQLKNYPYRIVQPAYGGIALFSRYPFVKSELRYSGVKHRPRVFARIKVKNLIITTVFAHPLIPIHTFAARNIELAEIAQEARNSKDPVIVAGDLNCTPWSYYFDKLKEDGKLFDSEQGFGPQSSWNVITPLLPIDHCLTSADFVAVNRYIGPAIGSDHLPVFIELKFKNKKSANN